MNKLSFISNTGISSFPLQFVFCSYWCQINQEYICEHEDSLLMILDKCIISSQGKPKKEPKAFRTSFPPPCSQLLRCRPLPSASKMFCFDLAALCSAIGEVATAGMCTGIRQTVIRQARIWALLSSQKATKGPEKLLLGESYQTNFILSYWTKIENVDSRCF